MIPISDYNPRKSQPYVTYAIIFLNIAIFLWQVTLSDRQLGEMFMRDSVVPTFLSDSPFSLESFMDILRSMFLHGSWLHVGGNMLYLWVFGDNIEDRLGKVPYVAFYLFCGMAAAYAQVIINPHSEIPMVGASGAIAGVLGAYLLLYPSARVRNLLLLGFFVTFVDLPALVVLGFWFVIQLFSGAASLGVQTAGGGTAFFAHIGGFVAGIVIMAMHRVVFGAPEQPVTPSGAGGMGSAFGMRRPMGPRQALSRGGLLPVEMPPRADLSPSERQHLRQQNFLLLNSRLQQPLSIVTPERTFDGQIMRLTHTFVSLRERDGSMFVIPLENVTNLG